MDTGSLVFLLNVMVATIGGLLSFLLYRIFGTLTDLNNDMKTYGSRLTVIETRCEIMNCVTRKANNSNTQS